MASGRPSPPIFAALVLVAASLRVANSSYSDVLLRFKATVSDPAGSLNSWAAGSAPCNKNVSNWAGVVCHDDGNVSGLRLEDMRLSGSLTRIDLLQSLPGLRTLSFMKNDLEGPLPEVEKFNSLRTLYLSTNNFSGAIPDDAFAGMSWLKKLHLSSNGFSGPIPTSIAQLPKLLELRLDNNRFSGPIPDLQLKSLKLVNMSNNYLEGRIPDGFRTMDAGLFAGEHLLPFPCDLLSTSTFSHRPPSSLQATRLSAVILLECDANRCRRRVYRTKNSQSRWPQSSS